MESAQKLVSVSDREHVVVTAQSNLAEPFKCGHCLMDFIQSPSVAVDLERFDYTTITYNKRLGHIHIQCGEQSSDQLDKEEYAESFYNLNDISTYQLMLEHSDTCPNRIYRRICEDANEPILYSSKNVKLAVCMAVFDSDQKILFTRRNKNLRIFPSAWVLPGGHIDLGETLE